MSQFPEYVLLQKTLKENNIQHVAIYNNKLKSGRTFKVYRVNPNKVVYVVDTLREAFARELPHVECEISWQKFEHVYSVIVRVPHYGESSPKRTIVEPMPTYKIIMVVSAALAEHHRNKVHVSETDEALVSTRKIITFLTNHQMKLAFTALNNRGFLELINPLADSSEFGYMHTLANELLNYLKALDG